MKITIFILYVLLIGGGVAFIVMRQPQAKLVATQQLPANHLVQAGDLSLRSDGRQYIARSLDAGEDVDLSEIRSTPEYEPKKGVVPFSLPAERDQLASGEIDVGKTMLVCPTKLQVEVRAVFCGSAGACMAIVDIAEGDAEKLKASVISELSLQRVCG